MKKMRYIVELACAAALLFAACTTDEEQPTPAEGAVVRPVLHIGVSEMTMHMEPSALGAGSAAHTRAIRPMSPDLEKYVKTLALFEFDREGLHDKGDKTFHFVDFTAGTVDGNKTFEPIEHGIVETTLDGLDFTAHDTATLCLVANVADTAVDNFYTRIHEETKQSPGRLYIEQFKGWSQRFDYEQEDSGKYDETIAGHVKTMFMFGYYEGPIDPATSGSIYVDLGRLASRLDITIVNETGKDVTKRLGYHFDNVCNSAYFFPIKMGMPATTTGMTRTVICKGQTPPEGGADDEVAKSDVPETFANQASHTRYFYVAAHSAKDESQATKLHMYFDRRILNDNEDDLTSSVRIPLCNVHPSMAASVANGYSLSRNTRYHFTIRLKPSSADPVGKNRQSRSMVEYGETPGDITVYLP